MLITIRDPQDGREFSGDFNSEAEALEFYEEALDTDRKVLEVVRPKKRKPNPRTLEMILMRLDGASYEVIAYKYGVTRARVHQMIGPDMLKFYDLKGTRAEVLQEGE